MISEDSKFRIPTQSFKVLQPLILDLQSSSTKFVFIYFKIPLSSTISSSPSWKGYSLSIFHRRNFKNLGITFLSLDASKEKLQLFHHTSVIGSDNILDLNKKDKSAKSKSHYYNIIPIPMLLTQVYLNLPLTVPASVAIAFFQAM